MEDESKKPTENQNNSNQATVSLGQPQSAQSDQKPTSGNENYATASLVLGIVSLILPGVSVITSIIGLILGILNKKQGGKEKAGIILNAIAIGLNVLAVIIILLLVTVFGIYALNKVVPQIVPTDPGFSVEIHSTEDTTKRSDVRMVSRSVTEYITNHSGKLPTKEDESYLLSLVTPDGGYPPEYDLKVEENVTDIPNFLIRDNYEYVIHIVPGVACGLNNSQFSTGTSERSFAVATILSDGSFYCTDNS